MESFGARIRACRVLGAAAVVFAVCGALAGSAFGADAFTPASGSPVAVGSNPLSVAWSPDGKTVAVVNGNDHSLSVFSASPDGKLTPLIGSPIQTGAGPQAVAFSPDDAMIAVANASASTVSTYVVNSGHVVPTGATGTTAVPGGHGSDPVSVAFSPDGSLIATADLGGYISLLQNGSLSLVSGYPAAVDPNIVSLAWGPNGTIAAADGTSDQVSLYAVTQPGDVLSTLSISPLHTGAASNPRKVAFSHDGQWIAAADRDANQVSEWNLVTGAPASGSPFATGAAGSPVGIAYSPGSNLLAIGKTNGDVLIAAVGASGGLSNVPGDPYTIDATSPIPSVAFGRAGGLLAAVDENNDQLAMLTVAPPTIAITSPSSHELYQQNSEAHVAFRCADAEAGPGIASCTGTQANGSALDTSHLAPTEEIDVTATSADGQVTTQSVDYALTPLHLSLNVTPSQAGTSSKPVPVKAELTIGGGTAGVVDPGYVLDLPVGIVPQQAGYKGCSTADSKAATLPTTCDASIVATGQMKVDVSTNPVSECKLGLQLVAVAKSATLTLRVAPPSPAVPHCPAALTTVAVKAGTVDPGPPGVHMEMGFTLPGTLSGPADGTHFAFDRTPSAFSLSFPVTGTKSKPVSFFSSVACPTPSDRILGGPLAWSATVTNSGDTAAATSPCEPFAPPQHRSPTRSSLKLSSKPPLTVEGTVVHTIPLANSYVVADKHGKLYTVHGPGTLPTLGTALVVGLRKLTDGQYLQTCVTTESSTADSAHLTGVVSAIARDKDALVLAAPGTAILLRSRAFGPIAPRERGLVGKTNPIGHVMTVTVQIAGDALRVRRAKIGPVFDGKLTIVGVMTKLTDARKLNGRGGVAHATAKISLADDGQLSETWNLTPNQFNAASVPVGTTKTHAEVEIIGTYHPGDPVNSLHGGVSQPEGFAFGARQVKTQLQIRTKAGPPLTSDQWQGSFSGGAGLACSSGQRKT